MKRIDVDKEIIDEIDVEEKKRKRKELIKKTFFITVAILMFISTIYVSLRYVGNYGIVVKESAIYNRKLNDDLHGLKIVHFSDIYYGEYTNKNQIEKLISKINYTNPDIVIYTGDLISKDYILSHEEEEYLISKLSNIKASIIKIAIKGEVDNGTFDAIMNNSDFDIFEDKIVNKIYTKNSYINIINLDSDKTEEEFDIDKYTIILTHNPDNIDNILSNYNPDLILSGHTLNGQVRIPLIGGLFVNSKYMNPYYEINNTKIYISGGIGNKKLNIRLFNNPSINFIRLRKEA